MLIAILVVVVGFGLFWALKPQAPSDVQTAKVGPAAATTTAATTTPVAPTSPAAAGQLSLTSFTFTGYGPGKSHEGTFKGATVSNVAFAADGTPAAGKFTIKTASISTGIDGLDKHLCSPDFFDCAANPEIVFDLTSIKPVAETDSAAPTVGATTYDVSGTLTFNKVTQPISFQATGRTTNPKTFSADFKFDTTFFNFKYVGIDKEVRIQFAGEVK
jgi:polyisoprenoid-binding protein YceI